MKKYKIVVETTREGVIENTYEKIIESNKIPKVGESTALLVYPPIIKTIILVEPINELNDVQQKELCFKLRSETGLGVMTCKKCLIDNNWDYDKAKENYKKYLGIKKFIDYRHV